MAITPSIALIPSGYKEGKVYSILPIDGSADFDFVRSGGAYKNTKEGIIEYVLEDVPRLDEFTEEFPVLELEINSTNLGQYTEDLSNSVWNKSSVNIESNVLIAPNGTLSADLVKRTSNSSNLLRQTISKPSTQGTYSGSIHVVKDRGDFVAIRLQGLYPARADVIFQFSTEEVTTSSTTFIIKSTKVVKLKNGWYKIGVTAVTDNHTSLVFAITPKSQNGQVDSTDPEDDASLGAWGFNIGASQYVASYTPNLGGGSVTRARDSAEPTTGLVKYIDSSSGVLEINVAAYANDQSLRTISLNQGSSSGSNEIFIQFDTVSNQVQYRYIAGGQVKAIGTFANLDITEFNEIKIKWEDQNFGMKVNGTEVVSGFSSNTDGETMPKETLSEISFARYFEGQIFYGKVKHIKIYKGIESY